MFYFIYGFIPTLYAIARDLLSAHCSGILKYKVFLLLLLLRISTIFPYVQRVKLDPSWDREAQEFLLALAAQHLQVAAQGWGDVSVSKTLTWQTQGHEFDLQNSWAKAGLGRQRQIISGIYWPTSLANGRTPSQWETLKKHSGWHQGTRPKFVL